MANKTVREQLERGIFDIDVIKQANQTLIETIEDSIRISAEGKAMRKTAVAELAETESKLRDALLSNKVKAEATKS
jgi:uncharacterized protein YaaN involved in tellurite resistance